jgi:hypothetical protein
MCEGNDSLPRKDSDVSTLLSQSHTSSDVSTRSNSCSVPDWPGVQAYSGAGWNLLSQDSTLERPITSFSSPSELLTWLEAYNVRLVELDNYQAPFPMACFSTSFMSLRHIYAAACLHSLSLEIEVLTPSMLLEIQTLALDQETYALQAYKVEAPPPAITALTSLFFAWVEIWQCSWDSAVPYLQQGMQIISKRITDPSHERYDLLLCQVGDFIEGFSRCIPNVLQQRAAMQAMPDLRLSETSPMFTTEHTLMISSRKLNLGLPCTPRGLLNYHLPPSSIQQRHINPRLTFATFHAHRALLWASGAYEEISRLITHPLPRPSLPTPSTSSDSEAGASHTLKHPNPMATWSLPTQTRHIRALLTAFHAHVSALLAVYAPSHNECPPLDLPLELRHFESPFAACMKHLSLFLGRKQGFNLQLWEGQCRLSVKAVCLFAIGASEEREGMRGDVLGVLRRGVQVRREMGLDRERTERGMAYAEEARDARPGGRLDGVVGDLGSGMALGLGSEEVTWVHCGGEIE